VPRSHEGKEAHMRLVQLAEDKLRSMRYEVTRFPRLKNKAWADIIAIRGDEKIVAECLITAPESILKRKLRNYKDFDKVIFVLPSAARFPLVEKSDKMEVWRFDVGPTRKRDIYPISLTNEDRQALDEIVAKSKISKADAIREAIKHYAEYLESLEVVTYRDVTKEQAKREIQKYLKGKNRVRADEISDALRIDLSVVNEALLGLWGEGWVEPERKG